MNTINQIRLWFEQRSGRWLDRHPRGRMWLKRSQSGFEIWLRRRKTPTVIAIFLVLLLVFIADCIIQDPLPWLDELLLLFLAGSSRSVWRERRLN